MSTKKTKNTGSTSDQLTSGRVALRRSDSRATKVFDYLFSRWQVIYLYIALLVIVSAALSNVSLTVMPFWKPDATSALSTAWQVHATIISIAFAGLAIALQLLSNPPLAAGPARRSIVSRLHFSQILTFAIGSDLVAGACAIWFKSDSTVLISFFLALLPSTATIAFLYVRTARIFERPHLIERWTVDDLKIQVATTSRELVEIRARNGELEEYLASNPLFAASIEKIDSTSMLEVRIRKIGNLVSVDVHRLDDLAQLLTKLEVEQNDVTDTETTAIKLQLLVRGGTEIREGRAIARLFGPPEIAKQRLTEITTVLERSLLFADTDVDYTSRRLRAETAELQDNLIDAIRNGRYSTTERGYDYYEEILSTARRVVAETADEPANSSTYSEWDWLSSQLWEINEAALRAGPRYIMSATGAAYVRCVRAVNDEHYGFFQAALSSYEQIWDYLVRHTDDNHYAIDHFFTSLQNLTEYGIPARKNILPEGHLIDSLLNSWLGICRLAYDVDETGLFKRCVEFHSSLFQFAENRALSERVRLGQLVLLAWIFMGKNADNTRRQTYIDILLKANYQGDIFETLRLWSDMDREPGLVPWENWELDESKPVQFGIISIGSFLAMAGLVLLARQGGVHAPADSRSHGLAQILLSKVDDVQESSHSTYVPQDGLSRVENNLRDMVTTWEGEQLDRLRQAPLSSTKIAKFRDDLNAALNTPSLADLFLLQDEVSVHKNLSDLVEDRVHIDKTAFVDIPDFFIIEPANPVQRTARLYRAREEEKIIERIASESPMDEVSLSDIKTKVLEWIDSATDPLVLVLGSHQVADRLGYFNEQRDNIIEGTDARIRLVYGSRQDYSLLLADMTRCPKMVQAAPVLANFKRLDEHPISIDITDISETDSKMPKVQIALLREVEWIAQEETGVRLVRVSDVDY